MVTKCTGAESGDERERKQRKREERKRKRERERKKIGSKEVSRDKGTRPRGVLAPREEMSVS